ncbi:MAG: hypothetical protein U9R19_15535, partial [Bacteroidota bacterium]|nr:hypothetical protein [Bacteroidota bacterium]
MKAKIFFILLMCVILNFSAKAQISLSYTSTDIMCYGDTNGVIGIVVSGGTLPYQYLWNNGATSQILINLGAGTYSVTVIDNVGSTGSLSIALTQPDQIQLSTSSDQTICMGQAANLIAAVNGGTPPYTYHWTPGGYTTGSIMVSPMQSTEYCVYVTDIVGCQSNQQCVTVFVYPPLQIQASASADSICQGDSVTIFANFSGGTGGPYSALLSDGTTSEIISPPYELNPVYTTTYIITVNDFCGTPSVSDTITITVSPLPEFTISSNIVNGCAPLTIGFYSTI